MGASGGVAVGRIGCPEEEERREGVAGAGEVKRFREEDGTEEGAWEGSERVPNVDEVPGCFVEEGFGLQEDTGAEEA